jgi:uncharacterized protein YqeY
MEEELKKIILGGIKGDDICGLRRVCYGEEASKPDKLMELTMIEKSIRDGAIEAMKNKDEVKKNILRVVIGEVDRLPGSGRTERDWISVIKKLVNSLNSTIESAGSTRPELVTSMKREKEILEGFLPKPMTVEDIRRFIIEKEIVINSSIGEGRAMGSVIKALKTTDYDFNPSDVKEVVLEMIGI